MAVLVTEIKKLLRSDSYNTETDFSSFIATANLIRTEDLDGTSLSDARKNLIETYLAAHFASLTLERGSIVRKSVGESSESYNELPKDASGLGLTIFGQQAISLDSTGVLADLASPARKAEFRVLKGTPNANTTDFVA